MSKEILDGTVHRAFDEICRQGGKPCGEAVLFDLTWPIEQVAEAYRAMDERRAIKTLLRP